MTALLLLCLSARAGAPEVPDVAALARDHGYDRVVPALEQVVRETRPRKLERALEATGLHRVEMPVRLGLGAELVLSRPTPLSGCAWDDGGVDCRVEATTSGPTDPASYDLVCLTSFGATMPLPAEEAPAPDGHLAWRVRDVERCWEVGGASLRIQPVSHDDLEGVGQGTELIPPELTALDVREVEQAIMDRFTQFKYCYQRYDDGPTGAGKLVVRYHIAEDGTVDEAVAETATFDDPRVVECVLERFRRLRFQPPMGGWEGGTFPFTFQR